MLNENARLSVKVRLPKWSLILSSESQEFWVLDSWFFKKFAQQRIECSEARVWLRDKLKDLESPGWGALNTKIRSKISRIDWLPQAAKWYQNNRGCETERKVSFFTTTLVSSHSTLTCGCQEQRSQVFIGQNPQFNASRSTIFHTPKSFRQCLMMAPLPSLNPPIKVLWSSLAPFIIMNS